MYDRLLEAFRKETESEGLQRLPEGLYEDVRSSLRELRRRAMDGSEGRIARDVLLLELDRMVEVSSRLVELRLRKMVRVGLHGEEPPEALIAEDEKPLLAAVMEVAEARDQLIASLTLMPSTEAPAKPPGAAEPPMLLIRFIKEVPPIVGADLRTYGPFRPEDVALLPAQNAEALIRQGAALQARSQ